LKLIRSSLIAILILSVSNLCASAQTGDVKQKSSDYVSSDGALVDELVKAMLAHNLELLAARQRLTQAEARLTQARLRPNPTLEFQHMDDRFLSNSGEREQELTIFQPIETGGRRGSRMDVARAEIERVRFEVEDLERQKSAEMASLIGEALSESARLYALERVTELNESLQTATSLRVRVGDASRYEFAQLQTENVRLEAERQRAITRLDGLMIQLRTLAGMPVDSDLKLKESQLDLSLARLSLDEAVRIAMQSRPDLKAALVAEREAEARIRLAESERKPSFEAIFGYKKTTSADAVNPSDWQLKLGVSVSIPVFNRNQGAIQEGSAALAEARLHRESIEQMIRRDAAIALRRLEQAQRGVKLYEDRLLPMAQQGVQMARLGFDLGEIRLAEYITEQRRLTDIESSYVQARAELFQAGVEVERAIGRRPGR
jgi:cobalt-zinc-cadmium efflux system outer membrane protein